MNVVNPLKLSEAYPQERMSDVRALKFRLQNLSRLDTLRYCAHLNLFISATENPRVNFSEQLELAKMFFSKGALKRIARLNAESGNRITVFNRSQVLELMRWVLLYCPDSAKNPSQNNQTKKQFAQAALIAGELVSQRMKNDWDLVANESDDAKRKRLLSLIRRVALESVQKGKLERAFGRGKILFFDYLPKELPSFEEEFQKSNHLSLEEYYSCLLVVMASYFYVDLKQGTHARHFINMKAFEEQLPHMTNVFAQYMKNETQTIDDLKKSLQETETAGIHYLKSLRQKPILWLTNDQAIVLDPVVHIEKAMVGPLFMLDTPFQERLGYFGKAFEKYAQNILQNMRSYPNVRLLLSDDLKIQGKTDEEIADACLIDGDQLLLFEIKAVFIPDDAIFDPDAEKYVNALRKKYGKKGKVADQLTRAIDKLTTGQWALPNHDIQKTRRIYPILLSHDTYLDLIGHYWFFASEFKDSLKPDGLLPNSKIMMKKKQWEIAPLTIMTVDVLENLEASVNNFKLADLLKDYHTFCERNFRDADDDLPLSEFISRSGYAQKMDYRGSVASKALEIFNESMQMILPDYQKGLLDEA